PPHSKKAACSALNCGPSATPSIVVRFAPAACSAGMRQLLTNLPSIKTEQEPHSPSPQPSFVPVNPSSCRRTSNSLSMGKTRTVSGLPFTVSESSRLAPFPEEWLIAPRWPRLLQRYVPARAERNRSACQEHRRSHLGSR